MASSHGLLAFRHLRLTGLRQRRDAAGAGALIVVLFRQREIRHIGHDALYLAGCTGRPGVAGTARNTRRTSSGPTRLGGGRERGLLYTSDAADERLCVGVGGSRVINQTSHDYMGSA